MDKSVSGACNSLQRDRTSAQLAPGMTQTCWVTILGILASLGPLQKLWSRSKRTRRTSTRPPPSKLSGAGTGTCGTKSAARGACGAAAGRPMCVGMRVPSSCASGPRHVGPPDGNSSPTGGDPRGPSTPPIDPSPARHHPVRRPGGAIPAALERHARPATRAPPSQPPSPSTPE